MKNFNGNIIFLNRLDINTDEIIPAKYLTEISKEALKPNLLEDLKLDGFDQTKDIEGKAVVISRENFGCGSSREHAPWAFEVNGINLVIAESFARIFKQNMFNCGMMAAELSKENIEEIFNTFSGTQTALETDFENRTFTLMSGTIKKTYAFEISEFDTKLIEAGGWVNYADANY